MSSQAFESRCETMVTKWVGVRLIDVTKKKQKTLQSATQNVLKRVGTLKRNK